MLKFTGIVASEKTVEIAEYLIRIYPEQDRLINELIDSITYGIACRDDAYTYIHAIDDTMTEICNAIRNESFDDRDLSDAEYEHAIDEIKDIAAELESFIDNYIDDLICEFGLYD